MNHKKGESQRFFGIMIRLQRGIASLVLYCMVFPLVTPLSAATMVVDPRDPLTTVPTLDTAQNGVPVVNIARPTKGGVSGNDFETYSVDEKGVVLNNSLESDVSQLGGALYENPHFEGNTARTVVFEVTGTDVTTVSGFTEMFGDSATFILANPNGMRINGGGFINIPQSTLTTGRFIWDDEAIRDIEVQGGI